MSDLYLYWFALSLGVQMTLWLVRALGAFQNHRWGPGDVPELLLINCSWLRPDGGAAPDWLLVCYGSCLSWSQPSSVLPS